MSAKKVTQQENIAGGDLAGGDIVKKTYHYHTESHLAKLMYKLRTEKQDKIKYDETLAELQRYETDVDTGGIIGLEEKLRRANREDLIERAMFYKEVFAKELARKRLHRSAQEIYVELLEIVFHLFRSKIIPLIVKGASPEAVDAGISEQVMYIMENVIKDNRDLFKQSEVEGMFYFLTGKCHICWHKE